MTDESVQKLVGRRLADAPIGQSPVHPDELARGDYWRVLTADGSRPLDLLHVLADRYWFGDAAEQHFATNSSGAVWAVIDPLGWYGMLSRHEVVEGADGSISVRPTGDRRWTGEVSVRRRTDEPWWHGYIEQGVWIGEIEEPPVKEIIYSGKAVVLDTDPVKRVRMARKALVKQGRKRR